MKKLLILALLIPLCTSASAKKDPRILDRHRGSVTFTVDDVTPRNLDSDSEVLEGTDVAFRLLYGNPAVSGGETPELISCSFRQDNFFHMGDTPLFRMFLEAYADHRPIVLTPDTVWLIICQGFSHYVNDNSEELRDLIVSHDGKVSLAVQSAADLNSQNADWETLLDGFCKQIGKATKGNLAKNIKADFSTSGKTEKLASEITLMDVVSSYFEYISFYVMCGIPSVTLEGTPRDWQRLLKKTKTLEKYGLGWWVEDLRPILKEFVRASKGKPDYDFWKCMIRLHQADEYYEPDSCGEENEPTVLDGWFLKFFPFDDGGRTPETIFGDHDMLPEQVSVPFRYQVIGADGEVVSDTPLQLIAGFVGVEEDPVTYAMKPKIGWMVATVTEEESDLHEKAEDGWIELRVSEVPEALKGVKHIQRLMLEFTGPLVLPAWMDDITIDEFVIRASRASQAEKDAVWKRFPDCRIE